MLVFSTCLNEKKNRRVVAENSVERVLNTAMRILERSRHPDAENCVADLEQLSAVLVPLWNESRDSVFIDDLCAKEDLLGKRLYANKITEHGRK